MPGASIPDRVEHFALPWLVVDDPKIRPYRSFLNLSEGKVVCIMKAPDQATLAAWFKTMNMPCDYITPVGLEGDRGAVSEP